MKRTTFIALIATGAICLTSFAALARDRGPDFSTLDADGSGEVSLIELQARGDARFGTLDTDGDGFLTTAELTASDQDRAERRATRMLERMDANADGKLSLDEIKTSRRDPARFFERMDADNSGGISQAEFEEARAHMKERHAGKPNRDN